MPIEQCRNIIMLYRLRGRAKASIDAHRKAGNRAAAEIYMQIDKWLEGQMAFAMGRRG